MGDGEGGAAVHGDFVQAQLAVERLPAANDGALEHQVSDDSALAGAHAGQGGGEFVGRQVRQESQFPQIHSQYGQLVLLHLLGGSQDRAVTAKHDGQVGSDAGEIFHELEVGQDDFGVPLDDGYEPLGLGAHVGSGAVAQQQDSRAISPG
jgi:hypothetical protein